MRILRTMVVLFGLFASSPMWAGPLISVDINGLNPYFPSPTFSGVEPAAAALDSLFSAANVWNGLNGTTFPGFSVNPAWSALVDSTGSTTSVSFSITGTAIGFSLYNATSNPDTLRSDFLAWNSNSTTMPGESNSISWQIAGLTANARYDMCIYGARADFARSFDMTIAGATQSIPTLLSSDPQPSGCVLFRGLVADSSGNIQGVGTGIGSDVGVTNEADWAGFQIAATPEPSGLLLLATGVSGLCSPLRRKLMM